MRVLVVDDNPSERASIQSILEAASFCVDAVGTAGAVAEIERDAPQVILLSLATTESLEALRAIRDSSGEAYLIAVLGAKPAPGVADVIAAGAHDFLCRPIVPEQLRARVSAPSRLIKWARSVAKSASFGASFGLVSRLRAWQQLGGIAAAALSSALGQRMQAKEGWPSELASTVRVATVPMSLPALQTEIRLSIVADLAAASILTTQLVDDPNPTEAAIDDLLRELANTAAGATKRAALAEQIPMTLGLPVSHGDVVARGDGTRCWCLSWQAGGQLAIVGEIRERENVRVPAVSLREGMVLAHDLRNRAGTLLASAGSRLTKSTAERVAELLGERFMVEVACPT